MRFGYEEYVDRLVELAGIKPQQIGQAMTSGIHIDYKTLRSVSPEAARQAVLEYPKMNRGNKADAT